MLFCCHLASFLFSYFLLYFPLMLLPYQLISWNTFFFYLLVDSDVFFVVSVSFLLEMSNLDHVCLNRNHNNPHILFFLLIEHDVWTVFNILLSSIYIKDGGLNFFRYLISFYMIAIECFLIDLIFFLLDDNVEFRLKDKLGKSM